MPQQILRIVYSRIVEILKPPNHFQIWWGLRAANNRRLRCKYKPKHVAESRVHSPSILLRGDVRKWAFTYIRSDVWDYHFFSTRCPSHNPPGPRNVAMPLSAEMPAPVSTTMFRISCMTFNNPAGHGKAPHTRICKGAA